MPKKFTGGKKKLQLYPKEFKTFGEFMDDCLRRCHQRMKDECGYGVPEVKQLELFGDIDE